MRCRHPEREASLFTEGLRSALKSEGTSKPGFIARLSFPTLHISRNSHLVALEVRIRT